MMLQNRTQLTDVTDVTDVAFFFFPLGSSVVVVSSEDDVDQ